MWEGEGRQINTQSELEVKVLQVLMVWPVRLARQKTILDLGNKLSLKESLCGTAATTSFRTHTCTVLRKILGSNRL